MKLLKRAFIIATSIILIFLFASCSEDEIPTDQEDPATESFEVTNNTYGLGDTWTVDGQWKFTINSITTTDKRVDLGDDDPAQVVIIDYSYENLGYEDESGLMEGLYLDLENAQVFDEKDTLCDSYPSDLTLFPEEIPVGSTCKAQASFGLETESHSVKIVIMEYGGDGTPYEATFDLNY